MKTLNAGQAELLRAMQLSQKRNAAYLANPTKGAATAAVVAVARVRSLLAGLRR